eukprot:TRINITY_DN11935_c0_g1_i1.p1 TRINITY_DN11935_c0_g1~~TRINITY_DN11935_c0_g1_i1.p1  ORF type:complete len:229 (+),score=14.49 TRINITY_DN11935_c0_g1_i1:34-720(+)
MILYGLVSYKPLGAAPFIVAEYHIRQDAEIDSTIRELIPSISYSPAKRNSYTAGSIRYDVQVNGNSFAFIAISEEETPRRISFGFLQDICDRFGQQYNTGSMESIGLTHISNTFASQLKDRIKFYNSDAADQYASSRQRINEVKDIMTDNLDRLIERAGALEDLKVQAQELERASTDFSYQATVLKRRIWWKNFKLWALIVGFFIAIIIAVTVVLLFHFGVFSKLKKI